MLNIEFKINLNEVKEQIEEIAKEAKKELGYIAVPVIVIGYIISLIVTEGVTAVASPEVVSIILAIYL